MADNLRQRTKALAVLVVSVAGLAMPMLATGCQIGGSVGPDTQAVGVIDDAISQLDKQSADWKHVLNDAVDKLTTNAQSTIRQELTNMLTQAIQAGGIEVRCGIGFIRDRVKEQLEAVKAAILGQRPNPLVAVACQPSPPDVSVSDVASGRLQQVIVDGYNFPLTSFAHPPPGLPPLDANGQVGMYLQDAAGARRDVTRSLVVNTPYELSVLFGANGVPLTATSQRIVVTWNGAILAQIGVTQPSVPPCATSLVDVSSSSQAYTPTHRTRGDANFWAGGGPFDGPHTVLVDTSIVPRNVGSAVVATITVHFQEEGGDQTTVDGTWTATLYQADPHVRIAAIVLGGQSYSDAFGHYEPTASVDLRPAGISYPVDLVTYRGFVGDNSAGTASATVRWRQLRLQLVGPPSGAATCSG